MQIKDLAEAFAKIGLPLIGAALPLPGGAAIGAALAAHIGAPSGKAEDILATLGSSAEAVEKAKEFQATHQETLMKLALDAQKSAVEEATKDVDSARNLAEIEIAHGNAFSAIFSALVRPLWGIGSFVLVAHSAYTHIPIDPAVKDIVMVVLEFYFGGKVIEAVTPHIAEAISRFASK